MCGHIASNMIPNKYHGLSAHLHDKSLSTKLCGLLSGELWENIHRVHMKTPSSHEQWLLMFGLNDDCFQIFKIDFPKIIFT